MRYQYCGPNCLSGIRLGAVSWIQNISWIRIHWIMKRFLKEKSSVQSCYAPIYIYLDLAEQYLSFCAKSINTKSSASTAWQNCWLVCQILRSFGQFVLVVNKLCERYRGSKVFVQNISGIRRALTTRVVSWISGLTAKPREQYRQIQAFTANFLIIKA